MDRRSNQTLATDATSNLSVSSVASSLANLDLNPPPIARLPNKLLQNILSKVQRMVPIQKFARLRAVDTRWRTVVDDISKSLILVIRDQYHSQGKLIQVEDYFYGLLMNETESVRFNIEAHFYEDEDEWDEYESHCLYTISDSEFQTLLKTLPNIEGLYIYCCRFYGLDRKIASYVNSLASLKQLYIYGGFDLYFLKYLQPTLSRLEFVFYPHPAFMDKEYVCSGALNFDYVRQLHARAPRWLASVTKLSFPIGLSGDQFGGAQIVNFLREHATRLNALSIKFSDTARITPALFGHLAKLTQLRTIALGPVQFEVLSKLSKFVKHTTPPLSTITSCNLVIADLDGLSVTVDKFTRVLKRIFPGVLIWKFAFVPRVASIEDQLVQKWSDKRDVLRIRISDSNVDEFFEGFNHSYTYF